MFTGRKKQDFFYYENRTEEEKPLQFLDFFLYLFFLFLTLNMAVGSIIFLYQPLTN